MRARCLLPCLRCPLTSLLHISRAVLSTFEELWFKQVLEARSMLSAAAAAAAITSPTAPRTAKGGSSAAMRSGSTPPAKRASLLALPMPSPGVPSTAAASSDAASPAGSSDDSDAPADGLAGSPAMSVAQLSAMVQIVDVLGHCPSNDWLVGMVRRLVDPVDKGTGRLTKAMRERRQRASAVKGVVQAYVDTLVSTLVEMHAGPASACRSVQLVACAAALDAFGEACSELLAPHVSTLAAYVQGSNEVQSVGAAEASYLLHQWAERVQQRALAAAGMEDAVQAQRVVEGVELAGMCQPVGEQELLILLLRVLGKALEACRPVEGAAGGGGTAVASSTLDALERVLQEHLYKESPSVLREVARLLARVVRVTGHTRAVWEPCRKFYAFLHRRRRPAAAAPWPDLQHHDVAHAQRAAFVLGLLCKHFDLAGDESDAAAQGLGPASHEDEDPCDRVLELLLQFGGHPVESVQRMALGGLCFYFAMQPEDMARPACVSVLAAALSPDASSATRLAVLRGLTELLADEARRLTLAETRQALTEQASARARVLQDQDAGAAHFAQLVQALLPAALGCLNDDNPLTRLECLRLVGVALGHGLVNPLECVPQVMGADGDSDERVRCEAVRLVVSLGEKNAGGCALAGMLALSVRCAADASTQTPSGA